MLTRYLPEFIVILGMFINILFSNFNNKYLKLFCNTAVFLSLICALFSLLFAEVQNFDLFPFLFKILICVSSLLVICLRTRKIYSKHSVYFNTFFLSSILFLMMIINSTNFLSLYCNIEMFSIALYFLLSMDKCRISFAETLKYMILSIAASVFLLFGIAFIYGLTGTISFYGIAEYITSNKDYSCSIYIFPFIFMLSGLLFKVGALPLGKWVIDIYKNIDARIVAFISVVPKLAIFVALTKILGAMITFETSLILIIIAFLTALFGVFYGYNSQNLRQVMAASSYVNVSYMLIALALYTKISISAMIFYWITYVFMNIGAFAGIISLEHSNLIKHCHSLKGYFYKNPSFSIAFMICLLSLFGVPLTSGFVAKVYLLAGIINSGVIVLPVILLLLFVMIISVCFYLYPIKDMFETVPYNETYVIKTKRANKVVLYVCTFLTLLLGIFPFFVIKICEFISLYS